MGQVMQGNVAITSFLVLVWLILMLGAMREIRRKHVMIWLVPYLVRRWRLSFGTKSSPENGPIHILFCIVDHFEPISAGSTREEERARMRDWLDRYPKLAARHRDSDGTPPQHTWFYPGENYNFAYLEDLACLSKAGFGEIELHLHHGHDSGETLRVKINKAVTDRKSVV